MKIDVNSPQQATATRPAAKQVSNQTWQRPRVRQKTDDVPLRHIYPALTSQAMNSPEVRQAKVDALPIRRSGEYQWINKTAGAISRKRGC